ncbi:glycosyltransferase [Rhodobacteraceae bacterium Araon29]
MPDQKKLSVIVPCLNEASNIVDALDKIVTVLGTDIPYELIVVDDQSDDDTHKIVSEYVSTQNTKNITIYRKEFDRRGYGAVIKYGTAYSTGDLVIFISADMVDPIHLLPEMYKSLHDGYDLVQVSRYLSKEDSSTIPFKYKFFQFFFRISVRICLGKKIPDSTYSFKMFDKRKVLALGLSSNRFNISPEIMFKAILAGFKIQFLPGAQGTRVGGVSKFNFIKEGPGFSLCLIRSLLHRKKIVFWF